METFKIKNNRFTLVVTFIIGLIIHMYAFTNFITNHDDVITRYFDYDQTFSGRWLFVYISNITKLAYHNNWVVGIFCLVCFSISVLLIVDIFNIENKLHICILAGLITSFPTIASWMLYTFNALCFACGLLAALISIKMLQESSKVENTTKKVFYFLGAAIFTCLSIACYQAFACIIIAMAYMIYIINGLKSSNDDKAYFKNVFCGCFMFILGYVFYYITLKLIIYYKEIELTNYQGISDMGKITISGTLEGVRLAYVKFFDFYFTNSFFHFEILKILNIIIFGFVLIYFIIAMVRSKVSLIRKIWSLVLLFMAPIFINSIYILTQGNSYVYSNMLFTCVFPYILCVIIISSEKYIWKKISNAICILLVIISLSNFLLCNKAYSNQESVLKMEEAYLNRVAMRVEVHPDYNPNRIVYFADPIAYDYYGGTSGGLDTTDSLTNFIYSDNGVHTFMKFYLGVDFKILYEEDRIQELLDSDQFAQMGVYPAESAIKLINDILVVKFK